MICIDAIHGSIANRDASGKRQAIIKGSKRGRGPARAARNRCSAAHSAAKARATRRSADRASPRANPPAESFHARVRAIDARPMAHSHRHGMRAGILRRGGDLGPGACAAEGARVARGIECGDLSPMREMRRCHERIHRLLRRTAGAQQCRAAWSKPRIGAMLGAHGSYSGLAPRDTRSTAIADVATAAPIRPVRGQRPMSEKVLDFMLRSADVREPGETASLDGGNIIPATGFIQLAVSVVLLSSAWPLTKIALNLGSTPLWFAEGRAVLSGLTAALILAIRGRLRLPHRVDLPALIAVGVFQLGGYFALAHEAVAWIPAGRTAILANTTTMWVVPLSLIFLHELFRWAAGSPSCSALSAWWC
jgi:hypothetical protein